MIDPNDDMARNIRDEEERNASEAEADYVSDLTPVEAVRLNNDAVTRALDIIERSEIKMPPGTHEVLLVMDVLNKRMERLDHLQAEINTMRRELHGERTI